VKAPDYVEPIIAWRAWLVIAEEEEIRLSSVVYKTAWPPRHGLEAECHRRVFSLPRIWQRKPSGHSAPSGKCRCRIYGVKETDHAASYVANALWRDEPLRWPLLHRAIGSVALWGAVVECEDGWRASRAYPQRIYLPKRGQSDDAPVPPHELAAALSSYGVPVELIDCDLSDGDEVLSALAAPRRSWRVHSQATMKSGPRPSRWLRDCPRTMSAPSVSSRRGWASQIDWPDAKR
jgi:hypothetical protein